MMMFMDHLSGLSENPSDRKILEDLESCIKKDGFLLDNLYLGKGTGYLRELLGEPDTVQTMGRLSNDITSLYGGQFKRAAAELIMGYLLLNNRVLMHDDDLKKLIASLETSGSFLLIVLLMDAKILIQNINKRKKDGGLTIH